jgi:hypothetical protein
MRNAAIPGFRNGLRLELRNRKRKFSLMGIRSNPLENDLGNSPTELNLGLHLFLGWSVVQLSPAIS